MFDIFLKNGEILPKDQAVVSLDDIGYAYGFGVYETFRVRNGVSYFVHDHMKRLLKSAEIIGLVHDFSFDNLVLYAQKLVDAVAEEKTYNVKIFLVGGKNREDAWLTMQPMNPVFVDKKLYRKGVAVKTFEYERLYPQAKSLNMLSSFIAYSDARKSGCYDAVFIDGKGRIVEGSRTNVFAIKNETIISPPADQILHGVARRNLEFIAQKKGVAFIEADIFLRDISEFDGLVLTSTSSKVIPVVSIDDYRFGEINSFVKNLMQWYDDFLTKSEGVFSNDIDF